MSNWSSVFAIAPDCHATNTGHYAELWRRHFYEGMATTGLRLAIPADIDFSWSYRTLIDPTEASGHRSRCSEQLRDQLLNAIETNRVDAVISYARSRQIDPALVVETEKRGIPWINFFCDSVSQFDEVRDLSAVASLNWFPESAARDKYRSLGRPVLHRPYALNPDALPYVSRKAPTDSKVGFVGLPSTNRVTILSLLSILGCPLEIHGHGWDKADSAAFAGQSRWGDKLRRALLEPHRLERIWRRLGWRYIAPKVQGPLDPEQFPRFLSECRLILGLNDTRTPDGRLESYLKFRDQEMPASGCCYLTQQNADITDILEPAREVLTFGNLLEARSLIKFYLKRPELCLRIGVAARERLLREHVWGVRLSEMQKALD